MNGNEGTENQPDVNIESADEVNVEPAPAAESGDDSGDESDSE
jgi:hypothetical protein